MLHSINFRTLFVKPIVWILVGLALSLLNAQSTFAQEFNPIPPPDPKPGSFGLEATKRQPPPTRGATITTPNGGASFSESPIVVNGMCPDGLLVQIYNNGVMVGAVMCTNGSFSLEVSLFVGTNELTARVYDDLGQPGPESSVVTVSYSNTQFSAFGELLTLTSTYGRRSAPVESRLEWPLQLSGGTGPYALSIDWGDGSSVDLKSQSLPGRVDIEHIYKKAGIYRVNIKATDVNNVSAFLQVIAVSSGQVEETDDEPSGTTEEIIKVIWIPAALTSLLLPLAYWLGRRSQIVTLRKKMIKEHKKQAGN